ncbi:hypothetical protein P4T74_18550 [Bacillus mycoides]|nr:hypothetical protein [Bacillus mycoides]
MKKSVLAVGLSVAMLAACGEKKWFKKRSQKHNKQLRKQNNQKMSKHE